MSIGFAKKIGMTRIFKNGKSVAVTAVQVIPSLVLQVKKPEIDGYQAVQVGSKKTKKVTKPLQNHIKKSQTDGYGLQIIEEFRDFILSEDKKEFTIADFSVNDVLDVTGTVKGRGFAGVIKRHGFHGQPKSHGHDHVRASGSIGAGGPQRVFKGQKMAGRMGNNRITLKKVIIVDIDQEKGLIFLKGSVPGNNSSFLKIRKVKVN